jgi:hypothetical protein
MEVSMNPFVWRREHQMALVLGAILGAIVLRLIGFMYWGFNYQQSSGMLWSASTARWAILGALIGVCTVYVKRLLET